MDIQMKTTLLVTLQIEVRYGSQNGHFICNANIHKRITKENFVYDKSIYLWIYSKKEP